MHLYLLALSLSQSLLCPLKINKKEKEKRSHIIEVKIMDQKKNR